ncbi:DUF998 domain-containing protein [Ktedonobacter sp. SOSP1-85]|uniref:DUF998 domain-containing protein n=1 Tax=Ktedonobacter sp. SOSP1-85 TaxID=2778367 RepID=UPI00191607C4|nr:DUF998 domain-containing protein [Ktedonobacter sp. SOSP1-85]
MLQRVLAAAGICAPILFAIGFVMQGFLRADLRLGYNPIAQEVSDLTAGPFGWVQQVNFIVFGLLIIAFAVGLSRGVRAAASWMVGPALVGWNGIELMIAGFFPRSENAAGHIYDPLGVHMMNGMIFFLNIGIVLVVLSLRFARDERWSGLALYTRVSGIALFVMSVLNGYFAEAVGDPLHPWLGLFQRMILAVWFLCLLILALRLWRVGRRDVDTHLVAPSAALSSSMRSDQAATTGIPRWVIVFGIITLLLLLTVVLIEITTNGMGGMQMSIPRYLSTIAYRGETL